MAEVSTGITITWETGFLAEILDVTGPSGARESLRTSHMGTTVAHTFTPADLVDWGELSVELQCVPGTDPPIDEVPSELVMTFPDSGAAVWTFDGFMTGFEISSTLEEIITASATIKITGNVVVA